MAIERFAKYLGNLIKQDKKKKLGSKKIQTDLLCGNNLPRNYPYKMIRRF